MTPTEIKAAGWSRVDPRPWRKCGAVWTHPSGWMLAHCGHPTALWPWALYAPTGELVCTGLALDHGNGAHGTAWPDLDMVMRAHGEVLAGRIVVTHVRVGQVAREVSLDEAARMALPVLGFQPPKEERPRPRKRTTRTWPSRGMEALARLHREAGRDREAKRGELRGGS